MGVSMDYAMYCQFGHAHGRFLGTTKSRTIEKAFDKMKNIFPEIYVDKRMTKFYVSTTSDQKGYKKYGICD